MRNLIIKIYIFVAKYLFPIGYRTLNTESPVLPKIFFFQKILGFNRKAYWPVHYTSHVSSPEKILVGVGAAPGLSPGNYISGAGGIVVGDYTTIGPNVGLVSTNHDMYNNHLQILKKIKIGRYNWIGMNSVITAGVELGDFTIVGAGSVVTKSFPEGYVFIAGNPAKVIRHLDKEKCIEYKNPYEYHGYIIKEKFEKYRKKNLTI